MPLELVPVPHNRQRYLGSSDAAAILGISPYRTPLDVYLDKTQPPRPEDPSKRKVFSRGIRMEPYVIDMLAEETGLKIVRRNHRYIDSEHPFIAAEIDAEAETGENIEIKTVSPFKAKEWGEEQTDEVPIHYTAQGMHAMMVTGAPVCIFGVLIGGDDFRIYRLKRDEETIALLREKEVEFWKRVVENNPPDITTVNDILRIYGKMDNGLAVEADDLIMTDVIRLARDKAEIQRIKRELQEREDRIKLYMENASILIANGRQVATWKRQEALCFNEATFKEAHPDLHAAFKKPRDSRVFRLKVKAV